MSDSLRRRFGAADAPLQSSIPAAAATPAAAPLPHFCTDHAASTSTGVVYINLLSCFNQISSPWVEKGKIAQSYFFIIIFWLLLREMWCDWNRLSSHPESANRLSGASWGLKTGCTLRVSLDLPLSTRRSGWRSRSGWSVTPERCSSERFRIDFGQKKQVYVIFLLSLLLFTSLIAEERR